jgi:hypothetical protein
MTSHSHATLKELHRNIYRDLSKLSLEFQSTHSTHRANPSKHGLIELERDESRSDPITYDMDDVIKHLRGACGLDDASNLVVTEQIRNQRREDI